MKLCLAGTCSRNFLKDVVNTSDFILESFYYFQDWQKPYIKSKRLFLLDSGAFTFINNNKEDCDYNQYLNKYIEFINKTDTKYFFELDIDSVVGYETVLKMRHKLESETGKKCIPVFHKSRGLQEWINMCKEYDYVAIGTIHEYKKNEHIIKELLKIAKLHNTKVHGLGFTVSNVNEYDFYSVDSTSWLSGARHGTIYQFTGTEIATHKKKNCRTIHYKTVDRHNLKEWIKYQKYLENL